MKKRIETYYILQPLSEHLKLEAERNTFPENCEDIFFYNPADKYICFKRAMYSDATEKFVGCVTSSDIEHLTKMLRALKADFFDYVNDLTNAKGLEDSSCITYIKTNEVVRI